jgi:hypothetical protein
MAGPESLSRRAATEDAAETLWVTPELRPEARAVTVVKAVTELTAALALRVVGPPRTPELRSAATVVLVATVGPEPTVEMVVSAVSLLTTWVAWRVTAASVASAVLASRAASVGRAVTVETPAAEVSSSVLVVSVVTPDADLRVALARLVEPAVMAVTAATVTSKPPAVRVALAEKVARAAPAATAVRRVSRDLAPVADSCSSI